MACLKFISTVTQYYFSLSHQRLCLIQLNVMNPLFKQLGLNRTFLSLKALQRSSDSNLSREEDTEMSLREFYSLHFFP